jgi:hypothetical protein
MTLLTSRRLFASLLLAMLPGLAHAQTLRSQAPTLPPSAPTSAPAGASAQGGQSAETPSAIVTPAVLQVRQALAGLRADKWKTPGTVTQETAQNLASIQRDIDSTLPGLLTAADGNPASVQDVLPAYRNLDALYNVLLRVTEISKIAAPAQQSGPLQQATASLEDARRTLGDQLQASALNQTKAIVALQAQLHNAQTAAPQTVAAAPVCAPLPTPAKKRTATRPKAKPATASPATPPATH